jgi:hypothetical protein
VYTTSCRLGDKDLLEATKKSKTLSLATDVHRAARQELIPSLPYSATAAVCTVVTGHTLQLAQATDVVIDVVAHARACA